MNKNNSTLSAPSSNSTSRVIPTRFPSSRTSGPIKIGLKLSPPSKDAPSITPAPSNPSLPDGWSALVSIRSELAAREEAIKKIGDLNNRHARAQESLLAAGALATLAAAVEAEFGARPGDLFTSVRTDSMAELKFAFVWLVHQLLPIVKTEELRNFLHVGSSYSYHAGHRANDFRYPGVAPLFKLRTDRLLARFSNQQSA